jgi:hypothetical protein
LPAQGTVYMRALSKKKTLVQGDQTAVAAVWSKRERERERERDALLNLLVKLI